MTGHALPSPIAQTARARPRLAVPVLHAITFLSGLAGLGYEIVWTRMLSVALGHEIVAVLAVVAAFFGGVALGAWAFDRRIGRSAVPGRWYAGFELAIGGWAIALSTLVPMVNAAVPSVLAIEPGPIRHWATAFLLPFITLLPATVAMGGTLPALERLLSRLRQDGWSVGGVYGANTAGAVAGTLLAAFVIIPAVGFSATLWLLAAINVLCAIATLAGPARCEHRLVAVPSRAVDRPGDSRLLITLFATGLLGVGFEVLVIRVLSQVLENTVYTFAVVLAVYLLGTAIGAALYQRSARPGRFRSTLAVLLALVSTLCLAATAVLAVADRLLAALHAALGLSVIAAIAAEVGIAAAVFLLPTVIMGALFSHLAQGMRRADGGLGPALAANMAGGALAPLLMGVLLLPAAGARTALVMCAGGYLLLLPPATGMAFAAAVPVTAALLLLLTTDRLEFTRLPPGGRVIERVDGTVAAVAVVADASDNRYLQVNTHFRMGGTATMRSDHRQAHIPLLLHPDPRRVLFLGLGTGATFAAAGDHPGMRTDGVELVPEIVPMLRHFAPAGRDITTMTGARLHVADARRFIRADGPQYDVIIADLFHPWVDGAGFLYTEEHFEAARARLAAHGLFCQWLPLHQLDLDTLRLIIRTFLAVFPDAAAYLDTFSLGTPIIALIGRKDGDGPYPPTWFDQRVQDPTLRRRLAALGLGDGMALFGLYLGGSDTLAAFAGPGPLNTDDRPLVLFRAPRAAYAPEASPTQRLLDLVGRLQPKPEDVLLVRAGDTGLPMTPERLAAYWQARAAFIAAGARASTITDARTFTRETAADLLEVVRISRDFEPAITPLRAMIRRLAATDPATARALESGLADALAARPAPAQ